MGFQPLASSLNGFGGLAFPPGIVGRAIEEVYARGRGGGDWGVDKVEVDVEGRQVGAE